MKNGDAPVLNPRLYCHLSMSAHMRNNYIDKGIVHVKISNSHVDLNKSSLDSEDFHKLNSITYYILL